MIDIQHSPLEAAHVALKGKLVSFAGWLMPIQYSSILDEHIAVRSNCGIFDISHMGQIIVSGPNATNWLNGILTNNVLKLNLKEGQYTLLLNESGGVIDDLLVYRTGEDEYFLVVNASMIEEDFSWLCQYRAEGIHLHNSSDQWAGMAIQGPKAAEIFASVFPLETLPCRNAIHVTANGSIICRTGYTGEDGFELFCPTIEGIKTWNQFMDAGVKACGLGARDSLRLEMGYPLNGNDLSPNRSPVEAGLGFFCDFTKGDFIGRDVLIRQKVEGTEVKLSAIRYQEKGAPPRAHYPIFAMNGSSLGELSSGVLSPSLMVGIGMAYLPTAFSKIGTPVQVEVRGNRYLAEVVKKPFYQKIPTA